MKTGAERYAEVQAMKPVDVMAVMEADGRAVALAIDESKSQHREQSWTHHLKEHDKAVAAVAEMKAALKDAHEALKHSWPKCSKYPEPVKRHQDAQARVWRILERIA